jgi:hypothetical protein
MLVVATRFPVKGAQELRSLTFWSSTRPTWPKLLALIYLSWSEMLEECGKRRTPRSFAAIFA